MEHMKDRRNSIVSTPDKTIFVVKIVNIVNYSSSKYVRIRHYSSSKYAIIVVKSNYMVYNQKPC